MRKTLLKFLTAVLGFNLVSSCFYLYASPHADFEAKGRVTDEEGNPVSGIMVDLATKYSEGGVAVGEPMGNDREATADDGTFHVKAADQYAFPDSLTVLFTDVDGVANGGEFLSKEVTVPVVKKKEGQGAWDEGVYGPPEGIEVTLKRKK